MRVLSALLVDGPRSIFHKKLIDSQIGTKFTHGTGYNGDYEYDLFIDWILFSSVKLNSNFFTPLKSFLLFCWSQWIKSKIRTKSIYYY
mgnify:CR=1 FL=1